MMEYFPVFAKYFVMTSKIRHDANKFVMTSKIRHDVKTKSF